MARCECAREVSHGRLETARDRAEQLETQHFARGRESFEHRPQRRQRPRPLRGHPGQRSFDLIGTHVEDSVSSRAGSSSTLDRKSPTNSLRCARCRVCRHRAAQKMRACSRALHRSVPRNRVTDDLEKSPVDAGFVDLLQHRRVIARDGGCRSPEYACMRHSSRPRQSTATRVSAPVLRRRMARSRARDRPRSVKSARLA